MEPQYQVLLLSELLKKSRNSPHPDFVRSLDYIFSRLEKIDARAAHSQFNNLIRWLRKLLPRFILIKVLYRLDYDAMMGFRDDEEARQIYGMISFQKHPRKAMIGMFDLYISPEDRGKDLLSAFDLLAGIVYRLSLHFASLGYRYIQCGKNETTRNALRLYQRSARKQGWNISVDIENSRLHLETTLCTPQVGNS
jgi:hypothetical protein